MDFTASRFSAELCRSSCISRCRSLNCPKSPTETGRTLMGNSWHRQLKDFVAREPIESAAHASHAEPQSDLLPFGGTSQEGAASLLRRSFKSCASTRRNRDRALCRKKWPPGNILNANEFTVWLRHANSSSRLTFGSSLP